MTLDTQICDRARLARDPRFDGLFFTGVLSTGIYCRPICPARSPKPENIVYFPSAAAAGEAGLRPCLRCRPERSPGSPAWNGTSATVSRAMLLIRQGALDEGNLEDLALKLGVGSRHLRRLFQTHVGASPKALSTTHKIFFAKRLLDETELPITQIAYASGFGSIRPFKAEFSKIYGKPPSSFRNARKINKTLGKALFRCTLTLSYRPPFDWQRMLGFFQSRAIPGVEWVAGGVYHRTIRMNTTTGMISVAHAEKEHALLLTTALSDSRDLMPIVERVRRTFDLDANMGVIHKFFAGDDVLKKLVSKLPGLRLPGACDPFEVAIRVVTGQQISVKGACTVIGRIAAKAGPLFESADYPQLTHFFPTAHELNGCDLGRIGMPERRARTIQALAQAVARGELSFLVNGSLGNFIEPLTRIPGIGDWTAQCIAMRALGEPDAFPAADLGIIKALQQGDERPTPKQILKRAENWRPWRAYAAIYLWHR
ncbi:MAG: DNA-3-methyladenine glycosylase 2 family protein [Deltaproteobacteria bacterium]|nr:DNA-3-methyladenine glycosylase 2 family protein [Deltaproteobacteria bacterium]